jgi:hypothetical protein
VLALPASSPISALCVVFGALLDRRHHPTLGRPLVVRNAYGTSIPHLEPSDIANFPVVRLSAKLENEIADLAEEAVALRASADQMENELTADADSVLERFIRGEDL